MLRTLAIFAALSACAAAGEPESAPGRDPGGSVAFRIMEIGALEARREEKRVSGECLSACTLYLGLSTACFDRDAVLGFHRPVLAWDLPMSNQQFEAITRTMATYYPPRLAGWWLEEGRHSERMIRIPAATLIARGEARACD